MQLATIMQYKFISFFSYKEVHGYLSITELDRDNEELSLHIGSNFVDVTQSGVSLDDE